MLTVEHYGLAADELRKRLGRKPFITMTRRDVTQVLRDVSGLPSTRIKSLVAAAITSEAADRGLVLYPSLMETGAQDSLRIYRKDSVIAELVEGITTVSDEADAKLKSALRRMSKVGADETGEDDEADKSAKSAPSVVFAAAG